MNFQHLFTIGSKVHSGWNKEVFQEPIRNVKVIRFLDSTTDTRCQMSEVDVKAQLRASRIAGCDIKVWVNEEVQQISPSAVSYSDAITPKIHSVAPRYGKAGDTLTIRGSGFGSDAAAVQVWVDQVECVLIAVSDAECTCTVGDNSEQIVK